MKIFTRNDIDVLFEALRQRGFESIPGPAVRAGGAG